MASRKHRSPTSRRRFLQEVRSVAPKPRDITYHRTHGRCWFCGGKVARDMMTRDHLVPVTRGGTHEADNIVLACKPCNQAKGRHTVEEYRKIVGGRIFYGERDKEG